MVRYFYKQSNRKQNRALTCTKVQRNSPFAWLKTTMLFCFLSHYIIVIRKSFRLPQWAYDDYIGPVGFVWQIWKCVIRYMEKKKEFPLTQISIASVMTKILRHRTPPSLRHPILMLYSQSFLNYFFIHISGKWLNLYFMYDYIWYFRCTS